ncbi:MAG: SUMF1/EgtB/PvdO family nonheme iron enzyme [Planctomycetes bacterium]|nr:SUMF1/EgtB/PvdO family nonheme iron enzyme [Planctomycetota bacterium]
MSAADPTAAFFANLRASGLLRQEQLQELWAWVSAARPDVQALAKEVSQRGWLTAFQIKEIFKGRGRDLTLDRYSLQDLLGEGGMGRVYKAHDNRMGRDVAIKIIRKDKLTHPAAAARFKQEIEALGVMKHPNVVQVYDADLTGTTHYYVMELIDGMDLTKIVAERGPLPVAEACEYIRQAALGLQHAFEKGLVHRDIKPSNIIVYGNGAGVKLVDLGLARLMDNEFAAGAEDGHRITQEGFVIGTPDFLAPEQARNPMGVDIRADIYALGGTLYYILTGKVPYEGATPTEKLLKHCTDPPPSLLLQRMDAPQQVEQIIHWCMSKQMEQRPQIPLQLAQALQPLCPVPTNNYAGVAAGRHSGGVGMMASGRSPVLGGTGGHAPLQQPPSQQPYHAPPPGYPQPGYPGYPPPGYPQQQAPPPGYPQQAPPPGYPQQAPPPGYPQQAPPPPGYPPAATEPDPNRSSQVFKLPPQTTSDDPIRRRAEKTGFPWSLVLLGLGILFVVGLLGWAVYAQFLKPTEIAPDAFTNSLGMKMVKIDGGTFKMGSVDGEPARKADEGPLHDVTIKHSFLISSTEVSNNHFARVMGSSPSASIQKSAKAQNLPVEKVTWDEANDFCKKLTDSEKGQPFARKGWAYRLPTEAEWEYAARAGTDRPFAFGPQIIYIKQALFRPSEKDDYGNGGEPGKPPLLPQEIGLAAPNGFGLSDVHGNVAEWCSDWYKPGYPEGTVVDPTGPPDGDKRVVRGGSFKEEPKNCRSASRMGLRPGGRSEDVGFRVVYAPIPK